MIDPVSKSGFSNLDYGSGAQAVVIQDEDLIIRVVTPLAEALFGWLQAEVPGHACSDILQCADEAGRPLCPNCGAKAAIERRTMIPPTAIQVQHADGTRRAATASFWYLPPVGRFLEPRAMTVIRLT